MPLIQNPDVLSLTNGEVSISSDQRIQFTNDLYHRRLSVREKLTVSVNGITSELGPPVDRALERVNLPFPEQIVSPSGSPGREVETEAIRETWKLPSGALINRYLWGPSPRDWPAQLSEDTWIFCRFQYIGEERVTISWTLFPGASISVNTKRTPLTKHAHQCVTLGPAELASQRIWCWYGFPPQDLFVYGNSQLPSASITLAKESELDRDPSAIALQCSLSPQEPIADLAALYWCLDVGGFTGSIAFIDRKFWQAAVAAVTIHPDGLPTRPDMRYVCQQCIPILWFDPAEGLAQYSSLLFELRVVQTVFVYGSLKPADFDLLRKAISCRPDSRAWVNGTEHVRLFVTVPTEAEARLHFESLQLYAKKLQLQAAESGISGAYIPRIRVSFCERDESWLDMHSEAIERRFLQHRSEFGAVVVINKDPLAAAAIAPLARYLRAAILYAENGSITGESLARLIRLVNHGSLKRATDLFIFHEEPESFAFVADILRQLNDRAHIHHRKCTNLYEIAENAGALLVKFKLVDRSVHMESTGIFQTPTRKCLEHLRNAINWPQQSDISNLDNAAYLQFAERLSAACAGTPASFYADVILDSEVFDDFVRHHSSPISDPVIFPRAILTNGTCDKPHVALLAASHASAKMSPLLFLEPPDELFEETVNSFFREVESATTSIKRAKDSSSRAEIERSSNETIHLFGRQLYKRVPEPTLRGMNACAPSYLTLIPSDNRTPYELIVGPLPLGSGWIFGVKGKAPADVPAPWTVFFRLGRLSIGNAIQTGQCILRGLALPLVERPGIIRLCSICDSTGDLPIAIRESTAVVEAVSDACTNAGYELESAILRGNKVTSTRVLDILKGDIDILHLACHGTLGPSGYPEQHILLADRTLGGFEIASTVHFNRYPIVLANICTSGRDPSGLLGAFVESGALACVATMWPVEDDLAALYGQTIARCVIEGFTLGTAVQTASLRASQQISAVSTDTSARPDIYHRAWALFGDPTQLPFVSYYNPRLPSELALPTTINIFGGGK